MSDITTDDGGMSLVELIVGLFVAGLFAGLLTIMFVNGWNVQQRSVARDVATGQASVLKTTMADALRNASAVRVSGAGSRVDAVVAVPSATLAGTWTWECRAWAYLDHSIRYSAGTSMRSSDASTWAVIAGKSTQRPRDTATGTISGAPFALVGSRGVQVGVDIAVVGDRTVTVSVSDGMTAQTVATTGAPTCWT